MHKARQYNHVNLAGLLLFLAGFIIFMGIITAEAYYPVSYSTARNVISDLGATARPLSVIYQPSATIFNISMMLSGLFIMAAVYNLQLDKVKQYLLVPLALHGIGIFGVGLFPNNQPLHALFAVITFVAGGVAALVSAKVIRGPFTYAAAAMGVIALLALLVSQLFVTSLGSGGIERWTAYSITIWLIGMGGYLLGGGHIDKAIKRS